MRTEDRSVIVTYLTHYVCSFSYTQLFVCLYLSQTCLYMFNDNKVIWFIITLCVRLYVRNGNLFICGKHLYNRMISLRVEVWAHKTNFIPPLFIEMPEPNQQSERTCICASVDFSSFCDFDHLTFELWYFLFFILVVINIKTGSTSRF